MLMFILYFYFFSVVRCVVFVCMCIYLFWIYSRQHILYNLFYMCLCAYFPPFHYARSSSSRFSFLKWHVLNIHFRFICHWKMQIKCTINNRFSGAGFTQFQIVLWFLCVASAQTWMFREEERRRETERWRDRETERNAEMIWRNGLRCGWHDGEASSATAATRHC